jgi:tRNA(Ile)-lysidine synthase
MNTRNQDLLTRFLGHVKEEDLFRKGDLLFLAVSGGLDSVVLTDLVHRAGFSYVILHANFQLRGEESDRDQSFVEGLGSRLKATVVTERFETKAFADQHKLSIQEAARDLRYGWFRGFLGRVDGDRGRKLLVTAHHADDNVETLLQHFFLGTGIAGLRGMLPVSDNAVRPLLFARRSELEAYAKERGLEWVEDSSNAEVKYTRNAIRHELIPAIEKLFPDVTTNMVRNLDRFRDIELLYRRALDRELGKLMVEEKGEWLVPVEKLRRTEPLRTIIWELFKPFGFTPQQVGDIRSLLDSGSGKYISSPTHRLLKNRNWLILSPLQLPDTGTYLMEDGQGELPFPYGTLMARKLNKEGFSDITRDHLEACLDAQDIRFPLLLRPWRNGDYFYPLGMRKKKKLARFLIDLKLSRSEKEKVWVVESDKRIIWVVGHRIDDRFKVGASTNARLLLRVTPS